MRKQHRVRRTTALTALACAGALAVGGAAVARTEGETASRALVFQLKERHRSGVTGTATITAARKGVRVVLQVKGRSRDTLLAHIHTGPCRREPTFANPRIHAGLSNVVRGRSVSTLQFVKLADLRARQFSINVHAPTYAVIACGDLPRR